MHKLLKKKPRYLDSHKRIGITGDLEIKKTYPCEICRSKRPCLDCNEKRTEIWVSKARRRC